MFERPYLRVSALDDDRGSNIVEICVALMVMATAITGVIGSIGAGFSLVGQGRQRSSASAVAEQAIEHVHNVPYAQVALNTCPTKNPQCPVVPSAEPNVSTDGTQYSPNGSGTQPSEPLVIDNTNGDIPHIEDPVTVGVTQFNITQYVTWVTDQGNPQAYKRVVVVVTWKFPVHNQNPHSVTQSTFVSIGSVSAPQTTPVVSPSPTPTAPGATPTPTPTPSASPTPTPGPCTGVTAPPSGASLTLLSGTGAQTGYTNSTTVQVKLQATDNCTPITADLSNDGVTWTTLPTSLTSGLSSTVSWAITAGNGTKTVYAQFRDGIGTQTTPPLSAVIYLDTTSPSTPGSLTKAANGISCPTPGSQRAVSLTWTASTDGDGTSNILGYRLYKSVEQRAFTFVSSTTSQNATDTDKRTYQSLRYYVTAYDKAGNESAPSNIYSLSKNQCF